MCSLRLKITHHMEAVRYVLPPSQNNSRWSHPHPRLSFFGWSTYVPSRTYSTSEGSIAALLLPLKLVLGMK